MLSLMLALFISISEAKIKIGIIDSGIDKTKLAGKQLCEDGHIDYTLDNDPFKDSIDHGSYVASALVSEVGISEEYCLVSYKVVDSVSKQADASLEVRAIKQATNDKIDFLVIALVGDESEKENEAINKYTADGTKFIFAAVGNSGKRFLFRECPVFPACHPANSVIPISNEHKKSNKQLFFREYPEQYWCYDGVCGTSITTGYAAGKHIARKTSNGIKRTPAN